MLMTSTPVHGMWGLLPAGIPNRCPRDFVIPDAMFGFTDVDGLFERPIPIRCAVGDSHASLFGQGCLEKGMCMTGYGTGSCVMMNLGEQPVLSTHGVLTSVAWKVDERVRYLFDGVINYSGAVITWICKDLGLVASPQETSGVAHQANREDRTYRGSGLLGSAPHWSNESNAVFLRMSRIWQSRAGESTWRESLTSLEVWSRDGARCTGAHPFMKAAGSNQETII